MSALRSIARIFSADLFTRTLSFFVLGYLARQLTPQELAVLPVYELLIALGPALCSGGLLVALIRNYPLDLKKDAQRARGVAVVTALLVSIGVAGYSVLVVFASDWIAGLANGISRYDVVLIAVACFSYGVGTIAEYLIWAKGEFSQLARIKMIRGLAGSLFVVLFYELHGLRGVIMGYVAREMLVTSVAMFYAWRGLELSHGWLWVGARSIVRRALPYWLESVLIYLRNYSDNWVVATLVGPTALSVYYVAKRFYWLLNILIDAIDKIVTLRLSELRETDSALERTLVVYQQSYFVGLLPLFFLYIAAIPAGLAILGGEKYRGGLFIAVILCVAAGVQAFFRGYVRTAFVRFSASTRLRITAAESAVLLPSLALGALTCGPIAIAGARVLATLAGGAYGRLVVRRAMRPRYWEHGLGRLAFASAVGAGLAIALQSWYPSLWAAPALFAVAVVVPGVLWPWWRTEVVRRIQRQLGFDRVIAPLGRCRRRLTGG